MFVVMQPSIIYTSQSVARDVLWCILERLNELANRLNLADQQAEQDIATHLYHCTRCDVTFIHRELETCPRCDHAIEQVPTERDLDRFPHH